MNISVAMCTYNGAKYIEAQLRSIIMQSLKINEIVICDDGSTDETLLIIEKYSKQYSEINWNIKQNNPSLGVVRNFEKALLLTTGDIIFLSDQDDIWAEDKVKRMSSILNASAKNLLLFTDASLIDENGTMLEGSLWDKWNFSAKMQDRWAKKSHAYSDLLFNINRITGATAAMKSSLKDICLPFLKPEGYFHDTLLGIGAASNSGLLFISDQLTKYRVHAEQQVGLGAGMIYNGRKEIRNNTKSLSLTRFLLRKLITNPYLTSRAIILFFAKIINNKLKRK